MKNTGASFRENFRANDATPFGTLIELNMCRETLMYTRYDC